MYMSSPGSTLFRLAAMLAGLIAILVGPWWLLLMVTMVLSVRYAAWEVPLLGLLADMAWMPVHGMAIPYATLASLCIVWFFEPLRARFMPIIRV